jgi:hypothetical protein
MRLPRGIAREIRNRREIVLRPETEADARDISALFAMTERERPTGPMLVAVADGAIVAALGADGGCSATDPFRASSDLVALLRLRAGQLRAAA